MKEELPTDAVLREFLLGKVDDEERARIESLYLTDSEAREKVQVIEQELMEDYLEDSLTAGDRDKFLSLYGQTAAQRRELRITKAIQDWARRENLQPTIPETLSLWNRLRGRLWLRPAFVIPIAVTALIAFVFGGIWLNNRMIRAAIDRELAALNTPAKLREALPQTVTIELHPIVVRSVERQNEFKKSADVQFVELRLPWNQERYQTYQAEVQRVGDDESFTIPNLPAESDGVIRLRLPAHMLSRGQYQIRLGGLVGNSVVSRTEEYSFTVSG